MPARPGGPSRSVVHVAALPTGAPSRRHGTTPCGSGTSPSGQCLRVLKGHSSWSFTSRRGPTGASSASSDNTLRLWDLASGQCLRVPEGHSVGSITSWRFPTGAPSRRHPTTPSALGPRLGRMPRASWRAIRTGRSRRGAARRARLSASWDNTLRLWDLASGRSLRVLKGHRNWSSRRGAADGRALSRHRTAPCGSGTLLGPMLRLSWRRFVGRRRRGAARWRALSASTISTRGLGPRLGPRCAPPAGRFLRLNHVAAAPDGRALGVRGTDTCGARDPASADAARSGGIFRIDSSRRGAPDGRVSRRHGTARRDSGLGPMSARPGGHSASVVHVVVLPDGRAPRCHGTTPAGLAELLLGQCRACMTSGCRRVVALLGWARPRASNDKHLRLWYSGRGRSR